ncbi:MAG: MFS transporter [Gammaproteobacteria bacterium]|nr:MFS transporter [Gammaproteobacteria bacterium]
MRTALAATWTLLLGMALLMLGAGLQGTLVGLRASLEGFPILLAGVMLAAYYLGYMAGSLMTPALVRSVGHIRVFAALTSLASVLILLQGVFVAPLPWTLVRILFGFCFAGIYIVAESWLNDRVDNEHRGLLLSLYMLVCYAGLGLGQLLLNLADPRSTVLFILVSILISVAMIPMALTASSAPEFSVPVRVRLRDLFRSSPLGVVGVAMSGAVSGCLFSLGAIYADGNGFTTLEVSLFMAVAILAGCLTQLPVGRMSDRMDRRKVVIAVCLLAAVGAGGAWWLEEISRVGFFAMVAAYGGMSLTLYSLSSAHVNDHVPADARLGASSTLILVNGAGAFIAPILVAAIMQVIGNDAFLPLLAVLHVMLAAYALFRMGRRAPVPGEQKTTFVGTPPGTSSSGELLGHASDGVEAVATGRRP